MNVIFGNRLIDKKMNFITNKKSNKSDRVTEKKEQQNPQKI